MEESQAIKIIDYKVDDKTSITVFTIKDIDTLFEQVMDTYIMKVWQGDKGVCDNISEVKAKILKFVFKEDTQRIEIGAIAEFLIHIYLNDYGYEQKSLFQNLEDTGYKKGFDGYYIYDNDNWIMESKSTENKCRHQELVKQAYKDIDSKINDFERNDPWHNAYNHASITNTEDDILELIKQYSKDFTKHKKHSMSEFNLIPASTIYYKDLSEMENEPKTFALIEELVKTFEYKNINIICINNVCITKFLDYLKR